MTVQTPGKIFLADQRGLTETARFRRYSTLNFGSYQHEHKAALGHLQALNEETLAGGQRVALEATQPAYVLIVPITGAVTVQGLQGEATAVEVEEVQVLAVPVPGTIHFSNPYETELVSFLHIWLSGVPPVATSSVYPFTAESINNKLAVVVPPVAGAAPPFTLSLGRFAGRHEAVYQPAPQSLFFAFVLAGAFEIAGRLLHERDGLALWNATEVALEALSNDALVVVLGVDAQG